MKKKGFVLLLLTICTVMIITVAVALVGCGSTATASKNGSNSRFIFIETSHVDALEITLYYDSETKWVYQFVDTCNEGGLMPLLSSDGETPAKYNIETRKIEY